MFSTVVQSLYCHVTHLFELGFKSLGFNQCKSCPESSGWKNNPEDRPAEECHINFHPQTANIPLARLNLKVPSYIFAGSP